MAFQKDLKVNIRKYYLYQFFDGLIFFSPIVVLFWQSHGLSMLQIALLQSIYSIGVAVLELPTGAFADKYGKRLSLILGAFFWTIGLLWYGSSSLYWQFIIGELAVGLGSALISGADRAYIHQLLKDGGEEDQFKKVEGKARSLIQISAAVANIVGGLLAMVSLAFPILMTSISTGISLIVGLTFPKTKVELPREERTDYLEIIKISIRDIAGSRRLLWLTLFFAAFNGLVFPLYFYSQPYLKMLGVPVYLFGVIFMLFSLVAAVGSSLTHQFETRFRSNVFIIMSIAIVLSVLLLGLFPSVYVFPLWSLFMLGVVVNQTIVGDYVLKIVSGERTSTILSFQSLLRRLTYAVVGPFLGIATDVFGITSALVGYSVFLFVIFGILLVWKKRI